MGSAAFNLELFLSTLAVVGAVIIVSALFSGVAEKTGVPQIAVFLGIGALVGPHGMGLLDAGVNSPILKVVSTLSLALVLFTDAVSLNLKEVREHRLLAGLVLGPGTLFSGVLIAVIAWGLLGLPPALAAILGASLSSTDPVLLKSFLRRPGLHPSVKQALRLESGMNDAILLPIVLAGVAVSTRGEMTAGGWGMLAVRTLLLSPAIGVAVAIAATRSLDFVRRKAGIRRDYESIYSLGVAFLAFAAAEVAHGSGFLAAFAAGLTIAALDVELCDCFLEYGETTAEMALLFTFVLLGASVIWSGFSIISGPVLVFVGLVFLARPVAFIPALLPAKTSWRNRALIAWFGPRGLSSLLLVLIAVFDHVPGATILVAVCSLVVLCSVILHGLSPLLLVRKPADGDESRREAQAQSSDQALLHDPEYITLDELQEARRRGAPVAVVDARTDRTYESDELIPSGAIRLNPDSAVADARRLNISQDKILAALCA